MSLTPKGMSVQEAYRLFREGKLIVNRKYQRKLVWTMEEKVKLIESIIYEYPIPLFLFAERASEYGYGVYEIMDGVQRLTSLFDFIENRISVQGKYFDIEQNIRAKKFIKDNDLQFEVKSNVFNEEECAKILDYQLAVTIYPAMDETDMIDVFGRINAYGKQLSNQEKRQAGVVNQFSNLVRRISNEIRGDVSREIVRLYEMPEISFDNNNSMNYGIKSNEIFWCENGILTKEMLKEGEDEEMIADILASVIMDSPFSKSKESLDELYNEKSAIYLELSSKLKRIDEKILEEHIIEVFSIIKNIFESTEQQDGFKKIVTAQTRNPAKSSFFYFYIACYDLLVKEGLSPIDNNEIMKSIKGMQSKLIRTAHYAKSEDRVINIEMTKGLIRRHFVRKEPRTLKHGAGLLIDFENSIKRSRSETSKYEFKQGVLRLSNPPKEDKKIITTIIETLVAIANTSPEDGYLYIGIADNESDAERCKEIYNYDYDCKYGKYIVGIDREIKWLGINYDAYINKFIDKIRNSKIDEPLKTQLMSNIDLIEYNKLSVIRVLIPKQDKLTFLEDKIYVRHHNSTKELTNPKQILAQSKIFE